MGTGQSGNIPSSEHRSGEQFFAQAASYAQIPTVIKATVAVARTVERYRDHETIYALTKEAIDHLGGIGAFVKPGQSVLIKPNQTGYFLADEGITTDPRLVATLIRLCKEAGASRISVGESSGMDKTKVVMQATGMTSTARAAGAEVIYFDDCKLQEIEIPKGKAIRRIAVPMPLLEADVIINACKGKTHHIDPITGDLRHLRGHHDAHETHVERVRRHHRRRRRRSRRKYSPLVWMCTRLHRSCRNGHHDLSSFLTRSHRT